MERNPSVINMEVQRTRERNMDLAALNKIRISSTFIK